MFGALVYELRVTQGGSIPVSHGRLLHAAVLGLIRSYSPELAAMQHDGGGMNDFTVAPLQFQTKKLQGKVVRLVEGDRVKWRVTALNREVLAALESVTRYQSLRIGAVEFALVKCYCEQEECAEAGVIPVRDFITACYEIPRLQEITLKFKTPVAFRVNNSDYPFPLPDLIWGSLAKKWSEATGLELPVAAIKTSADTLVFPYNWQGETKRVYLGDKRGVTGFIGKFTFDIRKLEPELQKIFVLLGEFAVFAGVGRLTGQGLGQTRVEYR